MARRTCGRKWLDELDLRRYDEQEAVLEEIRKRADRADARLLPRMLGVYGSTFRVMGRLDEAELSIRCGMRLARRMNDVPAFGDLLQRLAYVVGDRGDYAEGLKLAERAAGIYARRGDTARLGQALVEQGQMLYYLRRLREAIAAHEQALKFLPKAERRYRLAAAHLLGLCYRAIGDLREALRFAQRARKSASSWPGQWSFAKLLWFEGELSRDLHEYDRAEECFRQAVETLTPISPMEGVIVTVELVRVQLLQGRPSKAFETAEKATRFMGVLGENKVAAAAILELYCCGRTGLKVSALDRIRAQLEKARECRERHALAG